MRCHPLTRRERTQDHLLSISLDCRFCCTSELATNNERAKRPPLFSIFVTRVTFSLPLGGIKAIEIRLCWPSGAVLARGVVNNWHCASVGRNSGCTARPAPAPANTVESADASRVPSRFMLSIVMMRDDDRSQDTGRVPVPGPYASIPCLCRSGVPGCTSPRSSLLSLNPRYRLARPPCGLCEFMVKRRGCSCASFIAVFLQSVL
jgi:hypothetical protein